MPDKIKFFALGGLDESGKNMFVLEINGDIFVLDAGLKYPDKYIPGVDTIIPKYDYLKENKQRIVAFLISHGHDDQMGALPYIYQDIKAPIYCSKITSKMIDLTTKEFKLKGNNYDYHFIEDGDTLNIKGHKILVAGMTHSISGAFSFCFDTDHGYIVYTGDFIADYGAPKNHRMNLALLAEVASKGVLLLLSESADADKVGHTSPYHRLTPHIDSLFTDSPGRIFIALYSQNVFNQQEVIDLANRTNKKIIFYNGDNELDRVTDLRDKGLENIDTKVVYPFNEIERLRNQDTLVCISGSGEKLFATLSEIGNQEDRDRIFNIVENDTFIVACPPVPGTETCATPALDSLYRTGAKVINLTRKDIFSMHAREEDLKMLISLLRPKYYLPVKGDFKNLMANAKIALNMNMHYNHSNIFVFDNGMILNIDNGIAKPDFKNQIPVGDIMVDGMDVGNLKSSVITERQKMANDGVIVLGITVSLKEKKITNGPDVQMRGFIFLKDSEAIVKEITNIFVTNTSNFLSGASPTIEETENKISDRIFKYVRSQTGKTPLIIPQIINIDE